MNESNPPSPGPDLNHNDKARLFETLDFHTKQNEELMRGIYGDEKNKVKGLLERMAVVERWMVEQKFNQVRLSGTIAGITAVLVCGAKMIWDIIIAHVTNNK